MFWWIAAAAITVTLGSTARRDTGVYGQDLTKPAADDSIKVVYGFRGKVPGTIAWLGSNDNDTDDIKNDLMHFISIWSEGQIEGFAATEIDDFPYLDSRFNHSEGRWYYTHNFTNGMDGQFVDEQLEDAGFDTANYLYSGLAVSYERAELNADGLFNGLPNVTKDIKGVLCANFPKNSGVDTTASSVPTDQLYDYLINEVYGFGLTDEDVNYSSISNGKIICNEQIFTYQDSGEYKNRFTSNLILDTSKPVIDNVKAILKTMRGGLSDVDGKLNLVLEVDHEPVDELIAGEHFFSEDLDIEFPEINSRFNRVKATFYDPDANWQKQEVVWPETNSPEDIAFQQADGGTVVNGVVTQRKEYSTTIELEGCTNYYEARTTARVLCQRSRENLTASIIGFPETLKYLPGDIVPVTDPENGFAQKLFRVDEVELLDDGDVALDLTEHQPYIYTWLDENPKPVIPDTNLIDPSIVSTPTGLTVNVLDNGKAELVWNSLLPSFSYKLILNEQIIQESQISTTSLVLNSLQVGEYTFELWGLNSLGYKSKQKALLTFEVETPTTPTIKLTASNFSLVIEPEIASSYLNTTFNAKIHTADDFENAQDLGTATNFTVPVEPLTQYHVWLNTINLAGESDYAHATITTEKWSEGVLAAIEGEINFENLSSDAQDTLNQFDRDITSNKTETETTNNALALLRQDTELIPNSLQSTFAGAIALIGDNVGFKASLLGYKNQVEVLEGQVTAHSTSISQSASKIELESLKVELKGDISAIVGGDIDAALDAALGGLQGEMTLVKFFVGEDNLDGEQTITSMLTSILLDGEYASISEVNSIINSKGIENKVNQTEFTPVLTRVNSHQQILESNTFRQSLTSFAFLNDELGSLAQRSAAAQIALINNQLAMAREDKTFKGALAVYQEEITTKTTENSASVESLVNEVARVDNDIASAIEYTRAAVGYCIDEDGNITDETDAVACVAANPTNEWITMPLSEALSKVQITTADGQTASVSQLMQAFQTSDGGLIVRGGQITDNNGFISGHINLNDGTVGENIFIGNFTVAKNGSTSESVQVALKYLADTDELIIPSGTIVLTNEQKAELKGADGKNIAGDMTWVKTDYNGTWSNSDVNTWVFNTYGRHPLIGDKLTITNNNLTSPKITTKVASTSGSNASWTVPLALYDGSLIVRESISAAALKADEVLANNVYAKNIVGDVVDADVKTFNIVTIATANQSSNPIEGLKFKVKGNNDFSRFLVLSTLDVRHTDSTYTASVFCKIYMSNSSLSTGKDISIGTTRVNLPTNGESIFADITAIVTATDYDPWITVDFYRTSLAPNNTFIGERVNNVVCQLFKKGGDFY